MKETLQPNLLSGKLLNTEGIYTIDFEPSDVPIFMVSLAPSSEIFTSSIWEVRLSNDIIKYHVLKEILKVFSEIFC